MYSVLYVYMCCTYFLHSELLARIQGAIFTNEKTLDRGLRVEMSEARFDPVGSESPLWRLISGEYRGRERSGGVCQVERCGKRGDLTCGGCQEARYCSKEHQRQDWTLHKAQCRPFKVVRSPEVGRHLVATRDIRPGEVILEEPPVTGGPRQYTAPVCLGCHKLVSLKIYRNKNRIESSNF